MKKEASSPNALFSIIMEYQGGTYIRQLRANSALEAFHVWLAKMTSIDTPIKKKHHKRLTSLISNEIFTPVRINGTKNVWCGDFTISRSHVGVTIIRTEA